MTRGKDLQATAGKVRGCLFHMAAAAAVCAVLAATIFVSGEYARETFPRGALEALLIPAHRLSEIACLPFTLAGMVLAGVRPDAPGLLFSLVRAALAGALYGSLLYGLLAGPRLVRTLRRRPSAPGSPPADPPGLTRREALLRGGALAVGGAAAGVGVWVGAIGPSRLALRRWEIPIPGLPAALDGVRIGHITDTHFGPLVTAGRIRRAMEMLNAEEPDLTVLTGDYVYGGPESIEPGISLLAELEARYGLLAVRGNHEHWEGDAASRDAFARTGIPLIENGRRFLTVDGLQDEEVPGESLAICGIGDLWAGVVDPAAAAAGVSPDCPRLLLSHNPDAAERLPPAHPGLHFDLQISGHTHGGQLRFPVLGAPLVPSDFGDKYARGLVQGPAWPVLVSTGVGETVTPMRLGVRPEVGVIRLRRA